MARTAGTNSYHLLGGRMGDVRETMKLFQAIRRKKAEPCGESASMGRRVHVGTNGHGV